jgi:hypothetical protein
MFEPLTPISEILHAPYCATASSTDIDIYSIIHEVFILQTLSLSSVYIVYSVLFITISIHFLKMLKEYKMPDFYITTHSILLFFWYHKDLHVQFQVWG